MDYSNLLNSDFYSESDNFIIEQTESTDDLLYSVCNSESTIGSENYCNHDEINSNSYCNSCGIYVESFHNSLSRISDATIDNEVNNNNESTNNITNTKTKIKTPKTLSKLFMNLNLDQTIKSEAVKVSNELKLDAPRLKKRALLDFFCLYEAYKRLNITKDPYIIADLVGLDAKYVNKTLTLFSETQTKYKSTYTVITPLDLISDYCARLNLDKSLNEITNFANTILKKDPQLLDEMPRKVISAILKFYITINGLQYTKSQFETAVCFSEATLTLLYKRISNVYCK